jgi:hypothetical protein
MEQPQTVEQDEERRQRREPYSPRAGTVIGNGPRNGGLVIPVT